MIRIARKLSILLVAALLVVSMAACTSDEISLIEAISKTSKITSYEGTSKLQLSFKGEGFSEDTQKVMDIFSSYLHGFTVVANEKYSSNNEMTKAMMAIDGNIDMRGLGVKYGYWMDMDLTAEKPQMTQIIELPPAITQPLLTIAGEGSKKYITMDYGTMFSGEDVAMPFDLENIVEDSVELQDMLFDFIKSTAKTFDPSMVAITKKGSATTEKGEKVTKYELKLNDASAKKLLQALINDVVLQEEAIEFGKKYMEAAINIYELPEEDKQEAMAEIEKGLDELAIALPTYRDIVTQMFDAIKDVKIFADEGMVVKYYINSDGYLVGGKSSIDFAINLADISAALGEYFDEEDKNGVLYFSMDSENAVYNVNKEISVELPVLTEENSVDILDVIMNSSGLAAPSFDVPGFDVPGINDDEDYPTYDLPALSDGINVFMNGKLVAFSDVDPENINGRVLVPIRTISDEMSAEISYNDETKEVAIVKGDKVIQLTLGAQEAYVNGELVMLDTPAMVVEGRTMVPLRFISENMDAEVEWDGHAQIVYIFY